MKAVLFCRVSSKEQEDTGYSLPAQEKYLREFANKQELDVIKVFAVSESASGKTQRKVFNEMISYIHKQNISAIVVETTDRLTRNFKDVPIIDKWILDNDLHEIHLAKEGCVLSKNSKSHEWFMWRVKVATAEYYVKLLSENVKKGQKEKLAQGWLPSKPRLGYTNLEVNGHKTHILDEKKAIYMRKAFELYATGNYSLKRLADYLYEIGLRTHMGNKLVTSRLHTLLSDPYYTGQIIWNGAEYTAKHEPLVSKEIFERVQKRLKSKTTSKYQKHFFLFRGLMRCGECGCQITWETHKSITYGHCTGYKPCNQKLWTREDELEKQILFSLELLQIKNKRIMEWIRKALKASNQDMVQFANTALDELNNKLKAIEKRLSKLYDDKVDELITKEFYDEKKAEYTKEQKEIEGKITKHNKTGNKVRELGLQLYEVSQRGKEIFKRKHPEKKRILLNLIFAKLILKDQILEYEYTKAFKILAKLVELTNNSTKVDEMRENEKTTFVQDEKADNSIYNHHFAFLHPEVRRRQDSNLRELF